MRKTKKIQKVSSKSKYAEPKITIIPVLREDIITASDVSDQNQGEWDPQNLEDLDRLFEETES